MKRYFCSQAHAALTVQTSSLNGQLTDHKINPHQLTKDTAMFHTFQYKEGFYITTSYRDGKEKIDCAYSPSGYGYEWKQECKSVHAAKLAITKQMKVIKAALIAGMDEFTKHYIVAALWSSTDGDEPLDSNYSIEDISIPTLHKIIADCKAFQEQNAALLVEYGERYAPAYGYTTDQCAGHDFWLTRNRHGVGFWDRGIGELGDKLTKAAQAFGESDMYIGDDKQVWI